MKKFLRELRVALPLLALVVVLVFWATKPSKVVYEEALKNILMVDVAEDVADMSPELVASIREVRFEMWVEDAKYEKGFFSSSYSCWCDGYYIRLEGMLGDIHRVTTINFNDAKVAPESEERPTLEM